jgi:peptide chain release factor 2
LSSLEQTLESFETMVYLSDRNDDLNAIIEIHPGAGGTESHDWAEMLYRMYFRYAENKGFTVLVNDYQSGGEAGIKSATLSISGDYAFGLLKAERGVHRLVRISPFDASGRRHTSFASVNVVPEVDDTIDIEIKDNDLKIDTFRSSGAGGQSVNTTDSAVRITHLPTNMVVSCQNERSQIKNREQALKILKGKLYQRELEKQQEALNAERNSDTSNAFGSQIRSYVLHPYTMVKDHRTNEEMGNTTKVLDGEIDPFIRAYLRLLTKEARANENIT